MPRISAQPIDYLGSWRGRGGAILTPEPELWSPSVVSWSRYSWRRLLDGETQLRWQISQLIGTDDTDQPGITCPLTSDGRPYNAHVRLLRAGLSAGVRVGTGDKFQGQDNYRRLASDHSLTVDEGVL